MPEITLSELTYLNNASKALKQRGFVFINGVIVGLNNIKDYLIYVPLDPDKFNIANFKPFMMDAKELSDFVKAVKTESSFNILNNMIFTSDGVTLNFYPDEQMILLANNKIQYASLLTNDGKVYDINDIAEEIKGMKVSDGCLHKFIGGYYVTIFPTMIPLLKVDKLFASIYDVSSTSIVVRYEVKKSKFDLICYAAYLKI